ncbi:phosphoglycerate dehydrogenase [Hydrogenophaga sp. BPS33]|uniref:phosphoglycerate dehydrogenase n=1 Tax=Hydrogenophaga sp. BPS33 TaxID=2651974 RepID=UPI0013204833|nr:phosphoglycerate dehydrogenase [Hydrogenophaga sp. BPS33]QHE85257.1 phosphoglycerate dehydrogenase [Hydrogenophaga sp. BPS33]
MSIHPHRRRVVVTQRFFDQATCDFLTAHHCEPVVAEPPPGKGDGDLSEAVLRELLADAEGWIVGHAHVTDSLLLALPRLKVVARRGVGYERVDVEAVHRRGKVATIAIGGNDACVADHALALMLAVSHRLREGQIRLDAGDWSIPMGTDLYRKTVGIVGLGRIGRGVVQRLRGFEADVLVCTPTPDEAYCRANGVRQVDIDTLLRESDVVSLHAPLTPETRFMVDASAIEKMKPSAIVINTARGGLVNDRDLLAALEAGRLQGAGLDVFVSESDPAYHGVSRALIALPQVVATPHAGASTREGLDRTNLIAARSVVDVLDGATPPAACVIADGRTVSHSSKKGET